ncbi:MAG TPA: phosphoenolpyruvate--protein phosphotransferase [Blastocatellia bacterium]|nr:phosphoenolpyruvate--protein phosphotransferase [Blastocatellia bacterium]
MGSSSFSRSRDTVLRGLAVSPGIGVGRALRLDERGRQQFYFIGISAAQVRGEIRRLHQALAQARTQLQETKVRVALELGYDHSYILDAHLLMLEDENLVGQLEHEIRTRRVNAEWAVRDVTDRVMAAYKHVGDPYLRERASDIEDVATRLMTVLSGQAKFDPSKLEQNVIIVSQDILPSTVAELDFNCVRGFVTDGGGMTSHSAIIARALKIPAVLGLHDVTRRVRTGDAVVVDGAAGEAILRPTKPVLRVYLAKREDEAARRARRIPHHEQPAETLDGVRIRLRANVELVPEIDSLPLFGAEGIGLYRSEFMFLHRLPELPSEEEQYELYSKLARMTGDAGASIRVFDLGGDKLTLPGFEAEQNPALGLRAVRLSLKVEPIFRTQLRAILRANRHGRLRVVLPLVSTIDELRRAKRIIEEVKHEMADAEVEHNAALPVGVMIEVPAAALMADLFAAEADFLSVGTNDLIQYLLAVDRTNENVSHLYQPLHPAVLRSIAHLVRVAEAARVPLELCGEMAADPLQAIALVGLGIKTLSLVPAAIPLVKNAIRSIEMARVRSLMSEAMKLASSKEVEELLASEMPRQAPEFFAALAIQP